MRTRLVREPSPLSQSSDRSKQKKKTRERLINKPMSAEFINATASRLQHCPIKKYGIIWRQPKSGGPAEGGPSLPPPFLSIHSNDPSDAV